MEIKISEVLRKYDTDVVTDENRTNEVNYVVCDIKDYETEDTYDIIIDDGSHFLADVEHAVNFAITHLNRGGLFVIEDIQDARVWNSKIRGMLPNDFSFETFDLRDVNDQYDDYLILITHR